MTICSAPFKVITVLDKWWLQLVLGIPAVPASAWSYDHDLGIWQLVCTYEPGSNTHNYKCLLWLFLPASPQTQLGSWQERLPFAGLACSTCAVSLSASGLLPCQPRLFSKGDSQKTCCVTWMSSNESMGHCFEILPLR